MGENSFLTCFKNTENIANYILYDVVKNDVYADIIEVEHLLYRAQKINPEAPFDMSLIMATLIQNEPIFVDIVRREADTPYLWLRLKYPIHNFNVNFYWNLKPINVSQFQLLIMDPCLSVLREMYSQMTKMIMALSRNGDRIKLYQSQQCKHCGHKNNYSDLVTNYEDKQLKEFDREFFKIKCKVESFLRLDLHLRQYRNQVEITESSTSSTGSCYSSSSYDSSISDDCSQTSIISMRDLNESVMADKGEDLPKAKPVTHLLQQSNVERCDYIKDSNENSIHEESSESSLELLTTTMRGKTDQTKDGKNLSKDHIESISTSKMKDSVGSNKLTTLFEAQYNSSGRSSDESNIDENPAISSTEIPEIRELPTAGKAPIKQNSVNRSNNQNTTRHGACEKHPTVEKLPRYTWFLNQSKGVIEFRKIPESFSDFENSEDDPDTRNRDQYLRDRNERWRSFELFRPIYSDEYISAVSAQDKTSVEVIDSFERLVATRICTLNNSHIPHFAEDRSISSGRYKDSSARRHSEEKTVTFRFKDAKEMSHLKESPSDTLSTISSTTSTLNECESYASIPQSFAQSQGQVLDTDTEPVASTSSAKDGCKYPNKHKRHSER